MAMRKEDFQAFAEFERTSWGRLTEHYDSLIGRVSRQAASAALDAVNICSGTTLLDVATGPGYVAAEAARRGANAVGIDFSNDMVDVARRQFPGIRFDVGDAQDLEFADGSFDSVVCSFGVLHLPRPGLALTEVHRVLRRGGRYAFTVWCSPKKTSLFGFIGDIIQQYSEPSQASSNLPGMFMLSDPWVSSALMDAAGFKDVSIVEVPCYFNPTSPGEVVEFLHKSTVRPAEAFNRLPAARQSEAENALKENASQMMAESDGKIACPALLITGTKP